MRGNLIDAAVAHHNLWLPGHIFYELLQLWQPLVTPAYKHSLFDVTDLMICLRFVTQCICLIWIWIQHSDRCWILPAALRLNDCFQLKSSTRY